MALYPPSHSPYGWLVPGIASLAVTPPVSLPQSTTKAIFTISGTGGIIIDALWGIVTTAIQNQANATKFTATVTGLTGVDLCATGAIANLAVGSVIACTENFGTALNVSATNGVLFIGNGAAASGANLSFTQALMAGPGTIVVNCAASNTGQIQFYLVFRPILNATSTSAPANYITSEVLAASS